MIAFATVMAALLALTTFGRYVYATGGNPEAARLAGVAVDRIRLVDVRAERSRRRPRRRRGHVARPVRSGERGTFLAFTVLAGIVVGGTSIMGGEGAVWRTVVGCLFIALIGNGFNLLGLDPFYRQITLGVILLLAVGIDAWSRRTSS